MYENDTIAAAATAMGSAGIGIIRISGDEAFQTAAKIFVPADKRKNVCDLPAYSVHYGNIVDDGIVLDEVLLVVMRAPHSYTAEDTVEIDCHGGRLVMQKILEAVIKCGARPAEPGEFTKRAFLNGRIDLTQAESVMDLIESKNNLALKTSVSQLKGSVKNKIEKLRTDILYENAYLEAALDDPEHISLDGYSKRLKDKCNRILGEINDLLLTYDDGKILREGIRTVIVGKPNAGKSTLMNALLGQEKAIVTDIAGTTRDVLEQQLQLGDLSLILLDTAGIRKTKDPIESIGVKKAKTEIDEADLILYVADGSEEFDERDSEILELIKEKKTIVLLNKTDLPAVMEAEELEKITGQPVIEISAKKEVGIDELEKKIKELFLINRIDFNDEVIITSIRQKNALQKASESLNHVLEAIEKGIPEDFYSVDLMDAYTHLGYITGEETGEDLINEIFDRFCMGK